ncbi:unnamed protein product [Calypogeia fissa]
MDSLLSPEEDFPFDVIRAEVAGSLWELEEDVEFSRLSSPSLELEDGSLVSSGASYGSIHQTGPAGGGYWPCSGQQSRASHLESDVSSGRSSGSYGAAWWFSMEVGPHFLAPCADLHHSAVVFHERVIVALVLSYFSPSVVWMP